MGYRDALFYLKILFFSLRIITHEKKTVYLDHAARDIVKKWEFWVVHTAKSNTPAVVVLLTLFVGIYVGIFLRQPTFDNP